MFIPLVFSGISSEHKITRRCKSYAKVCKCFLQFCNAAEFPKVEIISENYRLGRVALQILPDIQKIYRYFSNLVI